MFGNTLAANQCPRAPGSRAALGLSLAVGLAACLLLGAPARAGDDDGYYGREDDSDVDFAEVLSAEPNLRQVRVVVPRQQCYEATRYVRDDGDAYRRDRPAAGPMILGGLLGAIVGHQFDHGRSRGMGTVAGAVVGAAVGHDAAQRRAADGDYGDDRPSRAVDSQRCETRYDERYESRIESYRVSYRYQGRIYHTTLPRDPGQQLRVRVVVTPEG